jgi:2-polyprenyl-3-methyl-5-hydroxy-6-metoxy-1,4-benzoquinol methylase
MALCVDKKYDADSLKVSVFFPFVKGMNVLDVGCGTGNLAKSLAAAGNACWGITVSSQEAIIARQHMKDVIQCDIETLAILPFDHNFFDVIVMADILEHLRVPQKALQLVKPYLKRNGTIVVSLPNVANLSVRMKLLMGRFDYTKEGILDDTHIRFFTKTTAIELLKNAGFDICDIKHTHPAWDCLGFVNKLCGKWDWDVLETIVKTWPTLFAHQFIYYCKIQ